MANQTPPHKTPDQLSDEDFKVAPTSADARFADRTGQSFPDWQGIYAKESEVPNLPWYSKDLDPDLKRALDAGKIKSGTFLDLGTGPATQAVELSKLGFDVTATDVSQSAIARAKRLGIKEIEFVLDDILNSKLADSQFDYIFDRGCFHVLEPADRATYVKKVASLLKQRGMLFLKTFSISEPRSYGPYHFSVDMIRELFGNHFEVMDSWETVFQGTLPVLPRALFSVLRRKM